jgi:outer membrane protein TolC
MNRPRLVLLAPLRWTVPVHLALLSLTAGCAGLEPPRQTAPVESLPGPGVVAVESAPGSPAGSRVKGARALFAEDQELKPGEEVPGSPKQPDAPKAPEQGKSSATAAAKETTKGTVASGKVPGPPLALPEAIALAFQLQPRLRSALESIDQAARRQDIVHAAFLPVATTGYHQGGFDLKVGGAGIPLGGAGQALAEAFTFVPFAGALPVGLNIDTGYEVAEMKVQWLLCDFGRRLGRYKQAGLAVDIARLQADRAHQTVANEVAIAYYQILRARALGRTARESVRRAEDDLEVARKLVKGGAAVRQKVLRAQVQVAQAQRAVDLAEEAERVAVAAFNLAVGLDVCSCTQIAEEPAAVPGFDRTLCECLETAIAERRELAVAQRAIAVAQEGLGVAKADFAPRLVAEGHVFDFQQSSPRGHADLALGLVKLEWVLFEGGKRTAAKHLAESQIRDALAQSEEVADTIAFQVNRAYVQVVTARKGIERARPAVEDARENYRLVRARYRSGEATSSDIVEAEATLTRAEEDYLTSLYDYRTALVRLDYAMGATPVCADAVLAQPIPVQVKPPATSQADQ